jgi:hypothetical protein
VKELRDIFIIAGMKVNREMICDTTSYLHNSRTDVMRIGQSTENLREVRHRREIVETKSVTSHRSDFLNEGSAEWHETTGNIRNMCQFMKVFFFGTKILTVNAQFIALFCASTSPERNYTCTAWCIRPWHGHM